MPISRVSKIFGIQDAKASALLTDPAGGTPTYGAAIDVPAIKTMEISGDVEVKELRGDNTLQDIMSVLTNVQVAFTHGKISLDVLAASVGGAVTDTGTTPNQVAAWDLNANDATLPPFKLEGVCATNGADVIGGDLHVVLHKCILASFPGLGFAEEDFKIIENEARCAPLISTGKWIYVGLNETATTIPVGP